METATTVRRQVAHRILQLCCMRSAPASLRCVTSGESVSTSFASFTDKLLTFNLDDGEPARSLVGPCCIVFCHGHASYLAITTIESSDASQIATATPHELTIERRSSIRLPIDDGLRARVRLADGRVLQARPMNLSLTGINIEISTETQEWSAQEWSVDDDVTLELSLGETETEVSGRVRWQADRSFGIAFSSPVCDGEMQLSPELQRIYSELQQSRVLNTIVRAGEYETGKPLQIAVPPGHDT